MSNKVRIFFRLTIRTAEDETKLGLPLPISCLIVALIWFWVRVSLGMPNETPLFYNRYWLFGDGLALALGIFGGILTILWIKDLILGIFYWIKDMFD